MIGMMRTPNIPQSEISTTAREACSHVRTSTDPPDSKSSSSWSSWCSCSSWWSWSSSSSWWWGWKILSMLNVLFVGLEVIPWLFTERIKWKPSKVRYDHTDTLTLTYLSMQILSGRNNFQPFLSPLPPPLLCLVSLSQAVVNLKNSVNL